MRKKRRLTITLPKEVLNKVDQSIDGSTIRNRSHAIESLIKQSLKPSLETAIILTGGDRHKINPAIKEIHGQKLISITVSHLIKNGISKIVVCTGNDHKKIKKVLGNGKSLGISIKYISEKKPTGTSGAIKKAYSQISDESVLVIHGDVLTDLNLSALIQFHLQEGTQATIAVMPRKGDKSFGKVLIEGNQITDFFEKTETKGIDIVNTGIYIIKSEQIGQLKRIGKIESDLFPLLAKQGQLTAFIFQGYWQDISRTKNYLEAKSSWKYKL